MSQATTKQITAHQITADQVSALGTGEVAVQYPDFIFSFGSNDARVVEQFSGASSSAMGSTATTGSLTYSGGAFTIPATEATLSWSKAVIEGFLGGTFRPAVSGFTLQLEVSSAAFATDASTTTIGFLAILLGSAAGSSLTIAHTNSTKSWKATQADGTNAAENTPTVQTENAASQAFDTITISYHGSAAGSDEGLLVVARNGSIILKQEPTNAVAPNSAWYIGGVGGEIGFNNLSTPMRNVMLISGPTVFPANVKICYMGDSNAAYSDYSLTSSLNSNHNPPLIVRGYEGTAAASTNYADPGTVTSYPKYTDPLTGGTSNIFQFFDQNLRCLLTGKLAARGLSPAGGKMLSSSRGGCQIYDWAGDGTHNDLIQRCDALYANDTHSYAVYPPDVLGSSPSVDTFIINLGGNDMTRIAAAGGLTSGRKTTLLNAYKARIDELVSGSSPNQILLLGVFPQYTFGKPNIPAEELTPALRGEMNAAISELNGYAGVCEYVSVDNFPTAALIGLDGVHFSVLGQEFIAELLASRIKL